MSSSGGSADSAPEADARARGKGVESSVSDDAEVEVVSQPCCDRLAASRVAGFQKYTQSNCILYKQYGWRRHVDRERAQCPSCDGPVPCKNSNTSNLWRHWSKCDKKAHDAAQAANKKSSASHPRQQTLSFKCVSYYHTSYCHTVIYHLYSCICNRIVGRS